MPDRELIGIPADPELIEAGRRAARVSLSMTAEDRYAVVTDESGRAVAGALLAAAAEIGAESRGFLLEKYGQRPLNRFPPEIFAAMDAATVTTLCITPLPGELRARLQLLEAIPRRSLRHAHLIAVSAEAFRVGMRADYHAVDGIQERMLAELRKASVVRVLSPAGTDLEVTFNPTHRWVKSNGLIQPGRWQNLPSGQIYTCPETLDGVYVADKSIGDFFESKYPRVQDYPVTVEFAGGRMRDVRSSNAKLAREFALFVRSNENGDRVGEFGVGTNPWLDFAEGQPTYDENVPGVHLALGDPFGAQTGAAWSSKTRVSVIGVEMSLAVDGRTLLRDGVYVPEILGGVSAAAGRPGAP
jgi:hypothetical protein